MKSAKTILLLLAYVAGAVWSLPIPKSARSNTTYSESLRPMLESVKITDVIVALCTFALAVLAYRQFKTMVAQKEAMDRQTLHMEEALNATRAQAKLMEAQTLILKDSVEAAEANAYAAKQSASAAHQSARTAQQDLIITNRAYLDVRSWMATAIYPPGIIAMASGDVRIEFSCEIVNVGRMPGTLAKIEIFEPVNLAITSSDMIYPDADGQPLIFDLRRSLDQWNSTANKAFTIRGSIRYNDGFALNDRKFHRVVKFGEHGAVFHTPEGGGNNEVRVRETDPVNVPTPPPVPGSSA